jgi:hypothetical protein
LLEKLKHSLEDTSKRKVMVKCTLKIRGSTESLQHPRWETIALLSQDANIHIYTMPRQQI